MLLSNPPDRTPAQYPAAKILTGSLAHTHTHTHVVICTVVESHGSLLCGMRFLGDAFIPTRKRAPESVRASACERGLSINKNHYSYPKAADTGRRALLSSNLPLPTASLSSFTSVLPSVLHILFSSLSVPLFHPFPLLSNSRSFPFSFLSHLFTLLVSPCSVLSFWVLL